MKKKKFQSFKKTKTIRKSTTVLVIIALILTLESGIDKMLLRDKSRNYVLLVSKRNHKMAKLNLLITKLTKILMSKIKLQQNQKWIKLEKIHAVNLLFFKVVEIKMFLLPCSIWKTRFLLLSRKVKSFHFTRLSRI